MDSYERFLASRSAGRNSSVIFGAELLPANSNRGSDLLNPGVIQGVVLYLDRLKELGVQGVTMPLGYPLYTPTFPRYQEYVQFYKMVVQEIRKREMELDIESSVLFGNTIFSAVKVDYSGLTFDQFKTQRKEMIATIIQDLPPDYLNMGAEPDTEYELTGFKEFNSPEQYTAYLNYVLNGLDRSTTKIGAGIGTWGNMAYVQSFATNTNLDFISMHVYPIVGQASMDQIFTIADLARQHGKAVILDEAWLYKIDTLQTISIAANADIFRKDAFSFWAPLDQQFLADIAKSAQLAGIEYILPFWTMYFFSYVDYDTSTAQSSYSEINALVQKAATQNMLADQFSSTGEFYHKLTGTQSSALSSTVAAGTPSMTESDRKILGFTIFAIAAGIIIGLVALTVLRRRHGHTTKR